MLTVYLICILLSLLYAIYIYLTLYKHWRDKGVTTAHFILVCINSPSLIFLYRILIQTKVLKHLQNCVHLHMQRPAYIKIFRVPS